MPGKTKGNSKTSSIHNLITCMSNELKTENDYDKMERIKKQIVIIIRMCFFGNEKWEHY